MQTPRALPCHQELHRRPRPRHSGFVDLNYKIFYLSSNIHHAIKTLPSEMAQLERRNLIQC
jgi:hypothetical protein